MNIRNDKYTVYKRDDKYAICNSSFNHLLDPEEIIMTDISSYSKAKWLVWDLEY